MIRVGLLGSSGKMGQWVEKLIATEFSKSAQLSASASLGSDFEPLLRTDLVIDFSSPAAVCELAGLALKIEHGHFPVFVIGSTGWKIDERKILEDLSKKTAVLVSSNFSTGVQALLSILKSASPLLEKLGYSPVIVDTHHKHKKDAPSGTAISIQRTISPAGPGNVQTHSVRGGEIIGDHEVTFFGQGDHLTIGHFAQDRSIFSRGALECGLWLVGKTPGMYSFEDYFKNKNSGAV